MQTSSATNEVYVQEAMPHPEMDPRMGCEVADS